MSVKITGYNNTHKEGTLYLFSGNDVVETLLGNFSKEEIDAIIEKRNNPEPVFEEIPEPELFSSEPTVEEPGDELATFNGTANQDAPVTREEMKAISDSTSERQLMFPEKESEETQQEKTFEERVEEKFAQALESSVDVSKYENEIESLNKENSRLLLEIERKDKVYSELVDIQKKIASELQASKKENQDLIRKSDDLESQNKNFQVSIKEKDSEIEKLKGFVKHLESTQQSNPVQEQVIPVPLANIPVQAEVVMSGEFFSSIAKVKFQEIGLTIIKDTVGNLTVATSVKHEVKDESLKHIKPFIITGTPADLDKEYFTRATNPIQEVQGLIDNSAEFLKAKELAEKESAVKKAGDDKIKKAEEAVSKLIKDDKVEDKDKAKLTKAVDALKKLDSENSIAKKALALLSPENSLFNEDDSNEEEQEDINE